MTDGDYLIPLSEVCRRVGLQKSSIYARVSAKTFPAPRKLGAHPSAPIRWLSSEVTEWIEALPTVDIRSAATAEQ